MQLESFKVKPSDAKKNSQKAVTAGTPDDADHVTYQLYYRPEQAKFSNNAKVCIRHILNVPRISNVYQS